VNWVALDDWGHRQFDWAKASRSRAVRWVRHRVQGRLCYLADKQLGVFDD
jgi:hypothetical protein